MEKYIRENDLDLFSEGSLTPEAMATTAPFRDVNILGPNVGPEATCSATSSCLSLDSFHALQLDTADVQETNYHDTSGSNVGLIRGRVRTPSSGNASEMEQDDVSAQDSGEMEHLAEQSGTVSDFPRRKIGQLKTNGSRQKCIIL